MKVTVADILNVLDGVAPFNIAEKWDNSGLQAGNRDQEVKKIWVALDPLPQAVSSACENKVDLLVTHHPLIFGPLKSLDSGTAVGGIVKQAFLNGLSIIAMHTNLDSSAGGVNDVLADIIGISNTAPLDPGVRPDMVKLAVFVPKNHEDAVLSALFETPAGTIGNYSGCSFRHSGTGSFLPGAESAPFSGTIGEVSHASEVRIETRVRRKDLGLVLSKARAAHPYETMAYDVFPVDAGPGDPFPDQGIGRIGDLPEPLPLYKLAERIKDRIGVKYAKTAGKPDLMVNRAALCSGSGSSLTQVFFSSDAQAYISGDLRYHDARDAENIGKGLIDIGHFHSEHIVVESLTQRLKEIVLKLGMDIDVAAYDGESDPFVYV